MISKFKKLKNRVEVLFRAMEKHENRIANLECKVRELNGEQEPQTSIVYENKEYEIVRLYSTGANLEMMCRELASGNSDNAKD